MVFFWPLNTSDCGSQNEPESYYCLKWILLLIQKISSLDTISIMKKQVRRLKKTTKKKKKSTTPVLRDQFFIRKTYHEGPLFNLLEDHSASLWHPCHQHRHCPYGQPANIETTSSCVELMNFGSPRPKWH